MAQAALKCPKPLFSISLSNYLPIKLTNNLILIQYFNYSLNEISDIYWQGWSRMALPIKNFVIIDVQKPKIGENRPNKVRADISVFVKIRNDIKAEWEALRKHDVCFLISLKSTKMWGEKYDYTKLKVF